MLMTTLFPIILIMATLLCALVAGFLFAFSIVTMPGIKKLNDSEFIRAFQVMDGVIQNNQPIFTLVWIGSVFTLLMASVLGYGQLDSMGKVILVIATLLYMIGVQLLTGVVNVPLNNQLQTLDVEKLSAPDRAAARLNFESRWNRWNNFRTGIATLVTALLILLLLYL